MKSNILKFSVSTLLLCTITFSISAQEKKAPNFEKMHKRFDTDGNGAVSLEEFKSVKRKNEVPVQRLEKKYTRLDADGNGALTLTELKENWKKGKGKNKKKQK